MSDTIESLAEQIASLEKRVADEKPRGPSTIASSLVEVNGKKLPGIVARERNAAVAAAARAAASVGKTAPKVAGGAVLETTARVAEIDGASLIALQGMYEDAGLGRPGSLKKADLADAIKRKEAEKG